MYNKHMSATMVIKKAFVKGDQIAFETHDARAIVGEVVKMVYRGFGEWKVLLKGHPKPYFITVIIDYSL